MTVRGGAYGSGNDRDTLRDTAYAVEGKIAQWLRAGVRLVWVIYPDTHRVQVHRPDGTVTKLQSEDQLVGEDVVPGFQCQITEIFQGL